jgi:hypothetical protein
MFDFHYGHLAHDSREHAVSLLDALAFERAVDAGWTPPPKPQRRLAPASPGGSGGDSGAGGHSVDVGARARRHYSKRKELISRKFAKSSDRPRTVEPLLATWLVRAVSRGFSCHQLPAVAGARLHKRSIPAPGLLDADGPPAFEAFRILRLNPSAMERGPAVCGRTLAIRRRVAQCPRVGIRRRDAVRMVDGSPAGS